MILHKYGNVFWRNGVNSDDEQGTGDEHGKYDEHGTYDEKGTNDEQGTEDIYLKYKYTKKKSILKWFMTYNGVKNTYFIQV